MVSYAADARMWRRAAGWGEIRRRKNDLMILV